MNGDAWSTEIRMVDACSIAPENIEVVIKPLAHVKINQLMKMFPNLEWLAYIVGRVDDDVRIIEDIIIPTQTVSSASVSDVEFTVPPNTNILGVMHSHHTMGASFSHIDDTWINQNHDLSIVVAHTGMKGQIRWKTPCGAKKIVDARISFDVDGQWSRDEFIEMVKENIRTNRVDNVEDYIEKRRALSELCMSFNKKHMVRKGKSDNEIPSILRGQNNKPSLNEKTLKQELINLEHQLSEK